MTSHPSVNFTPRMIFGNWLWPSRRRQVFCAPSTSLNTMASAVLCERHPFERIVLCRTVAKVLSIGFDVRRCFQCSQSAYDIRVAEEQAGREIAQLPTRPTGPVADQPKQPTLL